MSSDGQRSTITIVFTDQVGSTAFLHEFRDVAAEAATASHLELERRVAESNGGDVVKPTGDGSMLAFPSVVVLAGSVASLNPCRESRVVARQSPTHALGRDGRGGFRM